MHLSHQELRSLAVFFAKRFPSPPSIAPLAVAARLQFDSVGPEDPEADWFGLLALAQERGRLSALVRAASAAMPDDGNLTQLGTLVAPPRGRTTRLVAVAAVAAVGVLCAAGAVAWGLSGDAVAAESVAGPQVRAAVPTLSSTGVEEPYGVDTAEVEAPPAPEAAEVEPQVAPAPAPVAKAEGTAEVAIPDVCAASDSLDVVGWWYAGEQSPGNAGEVITVPRTLNVRAEWPGYRNGYDARTAVQCILMEGTALTLHQPPRLVPPGHYWVPLTAADLR